MSPVNAAVIIPHKNRATTIRACIQSIRRTAGPDLRIVVVDRGSSDSSIAWLRCNGDIELIEKPGANIAAAMNAGIAAVPGMHIVRVHADVIFESADWLERMLALAEGADKIGVIGGRLLLADGRISSEGRNLITGIGIDERHAWRKRLAPDDGRVGEPAEVDSVPGALACVHRDVLALTGGFDENYGSNHLEDDDLCLAARYHGYRVVVDPGVRAVHHHPEIGPTTRQGYLPCPEIGQTFTLRRVQEEADCPYWAEKWGFDLRRPDLPEIRRVYGHTAITWRIGDAMRYHPAQWPPTVDMVMVTWNNRQVLERCIDSLAQTRYPADRLHLHIADNGSKDGTVAYLESLIERQALPFRLTLHRLPVNTGVAVGFNWSIVHGDGELVARLDDDVIVPPQWLEVMVDDFRNRPYAGVVGPKILNDNAHRTIQCGPFRMYPFIYGHENEPDHGQADYVARVTHVRGCCNIYRRTALDDCGLFDLRYSPSQYDDPDHHVALGVAGWEIIYDGRVGVIHAMNSGAGRSHAAISNQGANQSKLFGKWGKMIWQTLEIAIEYSQEGRYLPDDGDTSRFFQTLPAPAEYPRDVKARTSPMRTDMIHQCEEQIERVLHSGKGMEAFWTDLREQARALRRDGHSAAAIPLLQFILDIRPQRIESFVDLADTLLEIGELDRAEPIIRRATGLAPEAVEVGELLDRLGQLRQESLTQQPVGNDVGDLSHCIGEGRVEVLRSAPARGIRVLMVNTFERRVAGGDMHQVRKMQQHLQQIGVDVTVSYTPRPDPRGYDLIHAWNLWFPQQTLSQIKGLHVAAPDTPIVMTPIYWDMAEKAWADAMVPGIFADSRTPATLQRGLHDLAANLLTLHGRRRTEAGEPNFAGYREYQRRILGMVDYLLPNSEVEIANLKRTLGVSRPYRVIYNGAEAAVFDEASPEPFVKKYGLRDFVITVGLVENRKNQLMLLHALKDSGIPLVVVGRNYDRRYLSLCRQHGPADTLFIEHLPHAELASALKAARVFALPSWMECAAFANVEAALAGCSLVVSDRTSEREYFGDNAWYCDPANAESIRDAVLNAFRCHEATADKRERLKERFRHQFTWDKAAHDTAEVYESLLRERNRPLTRHPELVSATA